MTDDATSDRALANRVLTERDEAAFRELYRRHTPTMYAIALRFTASEADAEDAVHDGWIRAVEGLARFHWRSTLRTWLVGILINRVREMKRSEREDVALDDGVLEHHMRPELPRVIDPIDLERALARMPVGYRRVFVLHDVEGFTHDDIARLLDVEPGTSKSQLARARQWLRRTLGDIQES